MQTVTVNNEAYGNATEATVFGPFFVRTPRGSTWAATSPAVLPASPAGWRAPSPTLDGNPVPGARIEVWEADEDGFYDVQYNDARVAGRAHLFSDDGRYSFWGLRPTPYPIPHDGPVGDCSPRSGDRQCAPATCISWSPPTATEH